MKQNMEKVGESESTGKILLICRHPYASFESGASDNGWNYSLQSIMFTDNNIVISRHSSEFFSILNCNKYKFTLKEWLKDRKMKNNWDGKYGTWGVYRPEEQTRQIIEGMLRAVCELHSHGFSHGFLYKLENFAIQDTDLVIGGDHKKGKRVFLIGGNHELNVPTNNNTQQDDWLALSNVIFEQILGATDEEWRYPQDLQNLRNLLEQTNDVSSKKWELIANHPSFWHWKSRFVYPERVWMHYENANRNSHVYNHMKDGFNKINVSGWGNNIPNNSPLWSVYNFDPVLNTCVDQRDQALKIYGDRALDLLRYHRNVRDHYRQHMQKNQDHYRQHMQIHCYDTVFYDAQYVELKLTEISELFLVNLYNMMCKKNIEI